MVDSKGTTYLALDVDLPVGDSLTLSAGAGRLRVPNFDGFSSTDWRLGASLRAGSLDWGLRATGSDADGLRWRARNGESTSGSARLAALVGWSFRAHGTIRRVKQARPPLVQPPKGRTGGRSGLRRAA